MRKMTANTKTLILIACILLIVIFSGILSQYYLIRSAKKLDSNIETAYISAGEKQWDNAKKQLDSFEADWQKTKYIWAILLDHFEIDNIDNSFTKSKEYIESEDYSSAVAELKSLRQYVMHIPQKESFSLENIL